MEKGKWNWPLVATVWGVYFVFFIIYLFYSRTPDYFTGSRTGGVVIDIYDYEVRVGKAYAKRRSPIVSYYVEGKEYRFYSEKESYLGLYKKGDKVTMIYNHNNPDEACILGLIGYWINITELIFAFFLLAFLTLFVTVIPDGYDEKVTAALTKK
jgi:hypothetical protein